jgi:hypothetical protein
MSGALEGLDQRNQLVPYTRHKGRSDFVDQRNQALADRLESIYAPCVVRVIVVIETELELVKHQ